MLDQVEFVLFQVHGPYVSGANSAHDYVYLLNFYAE